MILRTTAARAPAMPDEGTSTGRMKGLGASASVLLALCLFALCGCEEASVGDLQPLNINGREGAHPLTYETLMRVGAAARAGGDLANAVSIYRRAATIEQLNPAPFVAAGNVLTEMNQIDEAILAYKSALDRVANDPEALRGLAKAYLRTARPELAGAPLSVAYKQTPDDPKLLQLIGVADDFIGQHKEAQARYHRGLELLPADPALTVDLALSLALTGNYPEAIGLLRPVAIAPTASPRERQTLALVYGLAGDQAAAEQMARRDLDQTSVQHNLAYYDRLRKLSPEARRRALQSITSTNQAAAKS
jgi:Flp pilus assembly protein TadD